MEVKVKLTVFPGQVGLQQGFLCTEDRYDGAIDSNNPIGMGYTRKEALLNWIEAAEDDIEEGVYDDE